MHGLRQPDPRQPLAIPAEERAPQRIGAGLLETLARELAAERVAVFRRPRRWRGRLVARVLRATELATLGHVAGRSLSERSAVRESLLHALSCVSRGARVKGADEELHRLVRVGHWYRRRRGRLQQQQRLPSGSEVRDERRGWRLELQRIHAVRAVGVRNPAVAVPERRVFELRQPAPTSARATTRPATRPARSTARARPASRTSAPAASRTARPSSRAAAPAARAEPAVRAEPVEAPAAPAAARPAPTSPRAAAPSPTPTRRARATRSCKPAATRTAATRTPASSPPASASSACRLMSVRRGIVKIGSAPDRHPLPHATPRP